MSGYELPYKQVKLKFENSYQTAWLPLTGARLGCYVELKEDGYLWEVVEVYPGEMSAKAFKEHQKLNRDSLPSVRGK